MSGTRRRIDSVSASIVKEGFLFKKGDLLAWQKRYCVLNRDSFCYFKGSNKPEQKKKATGRVFLCDVTDITYDPAGIKKPFVFSVHIQNASHNDVLVFQAASKEDRDSWRSSVISAREREQAREKEDPLRRSMKTLTPGLRRATIIKDLETGGIGCFLTTDYEGRVFVDRISESGPLAETGVLGEGMCKYSFHLYYLPCQYVRDWSHVWVQPEYYREQRKYLDLYSFTRHTRNYPETT